jgi:hypothetical protein
MRLTLPLVLLLGCSSSSPSTGPEEHDSGHDVGAPSSDAPPSDVATSGGDGSADTWTDYAQAFVTTYCVECHGTTAPAGGYDLGLYATVYANRDVIRCGVSVMQEAAWGCVAGGPSAEQFPASDGKMPPNPKPTDAERERFVAWLSAGGPE